MNSCLFVVSAGTRETTRHENAGKSVSEVEYYEEAGKMHGGPSMH
jgi:hypothetical protein